MIGEKYNRLTAIYFAAQDYYWSDKYQKLWKNHKWYYFRCDCGNHVVLKGNAVKSGNTKSCGCQQVDANKSRAIHGLRYTPEYQSWVAMKNRCLNPNASDFHYYGGRGIEIHSDWVYDAQQFYNDMGERPEGYTLDRIDVNGHYCPENCQWASASDQQKNRRMWSKRQVKLDKLLNKRVSKL